MRHSVITIAALAALLLLMCPAPAFAKQVRGTVNTTAAGYSRYLDFFVFSQGPAASLLTYTINFDQPRPGAMLTFWDDEAQSWPSVYPIDEKTTKCSDIKAKALAAGRATPIVSGTAQSESFLDPARNHYWYFMFLDCDDQGPFNFKYNLHFVNSNGPPGTQEFSLNDRDFPGISGTFFAFYLILFIAACIWLRKNMQTTLFHPFHGLIVTIIGLLMLYQLCLLIHWSQYGSDGSGSVGLLATGELLEFGAEMLIMLVFVLMSHGWLITTSRAPAPRFLYCSVITVASTLVFLFFMMHLTTNSALFAYAYESVSGVLIVVIRLVIMVGLFLWPIRQSWQGEESRRTVSIFFWTAIAGLLWFISMPVFILFGEALAPFERNKFVSSLRYIVDFVLLTGVLGLFWPTVAERWWKLEPEAAAGPAATGAGAGSGGGSGAGYGATPAQREPGTGGGYQNLTDQLPSHTTAPVAMPHFEV